MHAAIDSSFCGIPKMSQLNTSLFAFAPQLETFLPDRFESLPNPNRVGACSGCASQ
jgi:hypothetical protein